MASPAAFTDADNWTGGFYELAIELGERSDVRIGRALDTLWRAGGIDGCYGSCEREPHDPEPVPCTVDVGPDGPLGRLGRKPIPVTSAASLRIGCEKFFPSEGQGGNLLPKRQAGHVGVAPDSHAKAGLR